MSTPLRFLLVLLRWTLNSSFTVFERVMSCAMVIVVKVMARVVKVMVRVVKDTWVPTARGQKSALIKSARKIR